MKKFFAVIFFTVICVTVHGQDVYNLDRNWKFYTYNDKDSIRINLPHSWNNVDALQGNFGYYRGTGNYLRYINVRQEWRGKRVFVKFYGANSVTDLMVNGRYAGGHKGGNNAFSFEITDLLDYRGRNLLWVTVSNSQRADVLPTAGEDNAYGGLFRGVELIVADNNVIGFDGYGGNGVMMTLDEATAEKSTGTAAVSVNSLLGGTVQLNVTIRDQKDSVVYAGYTKHCADKGVSQAKIPFEIVSPRLWQGVADPYLYKVTVSLTDGAKRDSVVFNTGVRSVELTAKSGFKLNGKNYPLKGVVVWRDRAHTGPIANAAQIDRDIALIREIGANAVRVAGGTHHPYFYQRCDEEGILVVADGPFVGRTTLDTKGFYNTAEFRDNAMLQYGEMIRQCYNNPSVVAWNIFVEPELLGDAPLEFVKELNTFVKKTDVTRPTIGISNKNGDINRIPDAIVWNHTFGWRVGMPEDIAIWRDQILKDPVWSRVCSAVSYRAGGSISQYSEKLRKPEPNGWWHPENWQSRFHETYMKALNNENRFWALFAGDMFDHGSVRYTGGDTQGVNDCGVVSFDRNTKKDSFWLYKANWNKSTPFVYITGKSHNVRRDKLQNITVYSNCSAVELVVNGKSLGVVKGSSGVFEWSNVELKSGVNSIVATTSANMGNIELLAVTDTTEITLTPGKWV